MGCLLWVKVLLINILNKTESAIYVSMVCFLFTKKLYLQNLFLVFFLAHQGSPEKGSTLKEINLLHTGSKFVPFRVPSKHTTSQERRYNVAATSRRCRDVVSTLFGRCVFAG